MGLFSSKAKYHALQVKRHETFIAGYDWAAGIMLRTPGNLVDGRTQIQNFTSVKRALGEAGDFEDGAQKAMLDFENLMVSRVKVQNETGEG